MYYNVSTLLFNQVSQMAPKSKNKKEKAVGARISIELFEETNIYLSNLDISMGQLIRKALQEYMWAHPIESKEVTKKSK